MAWAGATRSCLTAPGRQLRSAEHGRHLQPVQRIAEGQCCPAGRLGDRSRDEAPCSTLHAEDTMVAARLHHLRVFIPWAILRGHASKIIADLCHAPLAKWLTTKYVSARPITENPTNLLHDFLCSIVHRVR